MEDSVRVEVEVGVWIFRKGILPLGLFSIEVFWEAWVTFTRVTGWEGRMFRKRVMRPELLEVGRVYRVSWGRGGGEVEMEVVVSDIFYEDSEFILLGGAGVVGAEGK